MASDFDYKALRHFAVEEEDQWAPVTEEHDVKVTTRTVPGNPLRVARGVAVMKATKQAVVDVAFDPEARTKWDSLTVEARKVREIDADHFVFYMKSPSKGMVWARDFSAEARRFVDDDGAVVIMFASQEKGKEDCEATKSCVRGKINNCAYVIQEEAGSTAEAPLTRITYILNLDLAGWIPTSLVNTVLSEGPINLYKFRKLVEEN